MKDYEVISSTHVFKGKIIDVTQDILHMPDGREAMREVIKRGGASVILPIDAEGNVIFVRQYRHPAGELVLEVPAGMFDTEDEDPVECAARELQEETGLKAGKITFITKMYSAIGFCTEVLHIYLAEDLQPGTQHLDADEFVTVEKYRLDEAIDMIFSGDIKDAKTMVALLAYFKLCSK